MTGSVLVFISNTREGEARPGARNTIELSLASTQRETVKKKQREITRPTRVKEWVSVWHQGLETEEGGLVPSHRDSGSCVQFELPEEAWGRQEECGDGLVATRLPELSGFGDTGD